MFDVNLKDASLSYGDRVVFQNLNLTLEGGQWTCLLGGSGVGKTSLLRFIAGLSTAKGLKTSGTVLCENHKVLEHRFAWMAQQDSLLPWFNVLENVTLGSRLRKSIFRRNKLSPEDRDRAEDILAKVGLAKKTNELPQNLSGGQRQRVALARTLMEDKPLVLMDEPFGALDAITRLNLQDLACELLQDRTVFLITHDPLEALRLGHHIYHLQGNPATLTEAIMPPGKTPRSLEDRELMTLQGELLERLRQEEECA
ncbi:ABC transporter ATP-binding protein [Endozoicomonas sp. OPT23]|uniref:ABC transporter ATP-binding protein n=1 Tax=Endozoicomonas sp. OPT23 TaxID=2072845 RepID=UPI00129B4017|nr:ABC transporter ATP-binding protein [Endozoicomonas sp. OPT23]MRI33024.1 ABC transporter ATP-binding protein [Endozoicomonas sp. OPT23]